MVAKVCSEMTDPADGAGVESIANEQMSDVPQPISQFPQYSSTTCDSKCIYTEKFVNLNLRFVIFVTSVICRHYHFRARLPTYVRVVCPKSATYMIEKSWNCFPFARTEIFHPRFSSPKPTFVSRSTDPILIISQLFKIQDLH